MLFMPLRVGKLSFFVEKVKKLCYNELKGRGMQIGGERMKRFNLNRLLSNIMTLVMLIMMFMNTYVYATGNDTVDTVLKEVTEVLLTIAGLACVGKIIHIGILYMTSSAVDKSNAKSAIMPWLIGTIVCFGAAWIGGTIINTLRVDKNNVLDY